MKILQIVESLNNGAVENWLVNCFIQITRLKPDWEWTFFCTLKEPGKLERVVLNHGGIIIKSTAGISRKKYFISELRQLAVINDFDIIHAHHDYMNDFYLLSMHRCRAYKISQIHNTDKHLPIKSRIVNRLSIPLLRIANNVGFDRIIGISEDTVKEFKIGDKKNLSRYILYYGVSLEKYRVKYDKRELFKEFRLPYDAKVLLYIGRFTKLKNPSFLVEILHELSQKSEIPFYALFIGEGDEKIEILKKAQKYHLLDRIRLEGWVDNAERYFQTCDVFVFPRKLFPAEGFGMVMLESQAAGIQTVVSKGVSRETIVIDEIVSVLDDVYNVQQWAATILECCQFEHKVNAVELIENSTFNLQSSARNLSWIYENKA
jgi:glycosyltransferase involved in cell wall biosynthesis